MKLHPAAREYVHVPVEGAPADAVFEVSLDDGETWHGTEHVGGEVRFLAAGPQAQGNPAEAVVLPLGRTYLTLRLADSPEVVIRQSEVVRVTDSRYA